MFPWPILRKPKLENASPEALPATEADVGDLYQDYFERDIVDSSPSSSLNTRSSPPQPQLPNDRATQHSWCSETRVFVVAFVFVANANLHWFFSKENP